MNFQERLNEALRARGINQSELARALKVKPQSVQAWAKGHSSPRLSRMQEIASVLGVTVPWLTGETSLIEQPPTPDENVVREPTPKYSQNIPKVPLISSVQAGNWCEAIDLYEPGDGESWVVCPTDHSPKAFALRVEGPSMEPRFYSGEIIIVDPERQYRSGSFVIAKRASDEKVTFKQLMADGDDFYLRALNPNWPTPIIKLDEEWRICGVLICKVEVF